MKSINKYFLLIIFFSIITFIGSGFIVYKQVDTRKLGYEKYIEVRDLMEDNKTLSKALEGLDYLEKTYGENYIFNKDRSDIYKTLKKYDKSQEEIEKAFKSNEDLYNNIDYMISYIEISYKNNDHDTVNKLKEKVEQLDIKEEYKNKINNILSSKE